MSFDRINLSIEDDTQKFILKLIVKYIDYVSLDKIERSVYTKVPFREMSMIDRSDLLVQLQNMEAVKRKKLRLFFEQLSKLIATLGVAVFKQVVLHKLKQ